MFEGAVLREMAAGAARKAVRVWCRQPTGWTYGNLGPFEQGEVFALQGERGDARLLLNGLIAALDGEHVKCKSCPKSFATIEHAQMHARRAHAKGGAA